MALPALKYDNVHTYADYVPCYKGKDTQTVQTLDGLNIDLGKVFRE